MPSRGMTIGELAKAAGVNVETIRYYQRRGLISTPVKPAGGQRRYAQPIVGQIAFIRRAQALAFSLEEVAKLLAISDGRSCSRARRLAQEKLDQLGQRVAEINRMRTQLRRLVAKCGANVRGALCPFIAALDEGQARTAPSLGRSRPHQSSFKS